MPMAKSSVHRNLLLQNNTFNHRLPHGRRYHKFHIMLRYFLICLFFVFISILCDAQDRFFVMLENNWGTRAVEEQENAYVTIGNGSSNPYVSGDNYMSFTKISKEDGSTVSQWRYPENDTSFADIRKQSAYSIWEDKRIIITTASSISSPLLTAKYAILDENINEVVDNTWYYPATEDAYSYCVRPVGTDKILSLVGFEDNFVVTVKFTAMNSTGDLIWEQPYQCAEEYCYLHPVQIIPTKDGGYLLIIIESRNIGFSGLDDHEVSSLIKTDSLGVMEWQLYPGDLGMPYTSDDIVAVTTDDGGILCAWTDTYVQTGTGNMSYQINQDKSLRFAKIDLQGNKLWEKSLSDELEYWEPDKIYNLHEMISLSDGNIALVYNCSIVKITQNADIIWSRDVRPDLFKPPNAGNFTRNNIFGIIETSDNGFMCVGEALLFPGEEVPIFTQTGFAIKVDEYGCLEEGCQLVDVEQVESPKKAYFSVFPNPTTGHISLQYELPPSVNTANIQIQDITGKVIYTTALSTNESYINIQLDEYLSGGTYICVLQVDGHLHGVERFVLIR